MRVLAGRQNPWNTCTLIRYRERGKSWALIVASEIILFMATFPNCFFKFSISSFLKVPLWVAIVLLDSFPSTLYL